MRTLTERMLRAGEEVLLILRRQQFPFRAGFWLYLSEAEEWRLYLAVPKARAQGPLKLYTQLHKTLNGQEPEHLPPGSLAIVDTEDTVRPGIKAGDVNGHAFSRGTVRGKDFEDAYIYNVDVLAPEGQRQNE